MWYWLSTRLASPFIPKCSNHLAIAFRLSVIHFMNQFVLVFANESSLLTLNFQTVYCLCWFTHISQSFSLDLVEAISICYKHLRSFLVYFYCSCNFVFYKLLWSIHSIGWKIGVLYNTHILRPNRCINKLTCRHIFKLNISTFIFFHPENCAIPFDYEIAYYYWLPHTTERFVMICEIEPRFWVKKWRENEYFLSHWRRKCLSFPHSMIEKWSLVRKNKGSKSVSRGWGWRKRIDFTEELLYLNYIEIEEFANWKLVYFEMIFSLKVTIKKLLPSIDQVLEVYRIWQFVAISLQWWILHMKRKSKNDMKKRRRLEFQVLSL